jgi:hypothetical protein
MLSKIGLAFYQVTIKRGHAAPVTPLPRKKKCLIFSPSPSHLPERSLKGHDGFVFEFYSQVWRKIHNK